MKAFSFPLESIRLLRQQRERAAQQRYARALAVCENAERKLGAANEELAAGYKLLAEELGHSSTINRLTQIRTWCAVLQMRFHECEAAVVEARRAAGEAFNFLCAATRDRETLDRFHEKSRRAWQRLCQQAEQKMLDELAIQRQSSPALEHNFLN
jgi:flagellar export protein FliJ